MVNVIIYLIATIGVGVQVYGALNSTLWWAPNPPLPMVGLVGTLLMLLGTAWGAIKGSSSAWIVFIGAMVCWAFYIPGLGSLMGGLRESIATGKISLATLSTYLPLLPPALLVIATYTSLVVGPMGKTQD